MSRIGPSVNNRPLSPNPPPTCVLQKKARVLDAPPDNHAFVGTVQKVSQKSKAIFIGKSKETFSYYRNGNTNPTLVSMSSLASTVQEVGKFILYLNKAKSGSISVTLVRV